MSGTDKWNLRYEGSQIKEQVKWDFFVNINEDKNGLRFIVSISSEKQAKLNLMLQEG
jgi:hypothetical protein